MVRKNRVPRERIEYLHTVPLFQGLPRGVLERLDGHVYDAVVKAGTRLTAEGANAYETFIVVEGVAEVVVDGKVVGEVGPGELVGEVAVLQHSRRTATVTAKTDMDLIVINSHEIDWLFSHKDLADRVREDLERHLRGSQPTG